MLSIQVTNKKQNQRFEHAKGPLEFGRGPRRQAERFVVNDLFVSRDQLRLEELPDGRARVDNLSGKQPVVSSDGTTLGVGTVREYQLPIRLALGETLIEIERVPDEEGSQPLLTIPQPVGNSDSTMLCQPLQQLGDSPEPEKLAQWVETVIALQRSTTGSPDFYDQTARALVNLVGLDVGLVLLRQDWTWQVAGRFPPDYKSSNPFSRTLLSHVVAERRTFYQDLEKWRAQTESLQGIEAVVVSPIVNQRDEVVGVLYGSRGQKLLEKVSGIRPLEAQMVQLLAAAVGANLARAVAIRKRVQFEQFFSADLVRELERDPSLLEDRNEEVTVLISSLAGAQVLAEKLGPKYASRLMREMMERLSEQIVEHNGVIVNYVGETILAMWNAPLRHAEHPLQACGAALAMLGEIGEMSGKWQEKTGVPLTLAIGMHTGPALVGNLGSSHKFQYGPLGPAVHVARRIHKATGRFNLPLLLSGPTRDRLPDALATRRLCQIRGAGISGSVDLYELHGVTGSRDWLTRRDAYESALMLYETCQWAKALQALQPLLEAQQEHPDVATLYLHKKAQERLESPSKAFDPVVDLNAP